jgi:hypothetical protein
VFSIDLFLDIEPTLHPWKILHLGIVCNAFIHYFNPFVDAFKRIFASVFIKCFDLYILYCFVFFFSSLG